MKIRLTLVFSLCAYAILAQDVNYAKRIVDTLASSNYYGRGYVNNGVNKAANFIRSEFENAGLQDISFQNFNHAVNTFPNKLEVSLNNKSLKPGIDFLVLPTSSGANNLTLSLAYIKVKHVKSLKKFERFLRKHSWGNTALVISKDIYTQVNDDAVGKALANNSFKAAAFITLTATKLTWSVRNFSKGYPELEILETAFVDKPKEIFINIEQKLETVFTSKNVLGYLPGANTDSLIFFTAHYDHLGMMGSEACFYGTNDNAGGVAMLLDLARFYAENEELRKYSMVFVAFAGEEAGLVGSKYYTENPIYPLEKISLLINLDLVTNGQDGMTVVNGRVFKKIFQSLKSINEEKGYMSAIKSRGKAANSDHYHFSEKGIKAIFIYLLGDYPYYHDVNDTPDKPSWAGYDNFFLLLVELCQKWPN